LLNVNFDGKVIWFADDAALLFNDNCLDKLYYKANAGLSFVKQWLDNNSLELNFDKSYYLHFSISKWNIDMSRYKIVLYNNTISSQKNVGGYVLKTLNSVKYLGIFIDENLKWNIHIDHNNIIRFFWFLY